MRKITALAAAVMITATTHSAVKVGVYDYNQTFMTSTGQTYEHIFLGSWGNLNLLYPQQTGNNVAIALANIRGRNRIPLLTVQPYHISSIGSAPNLLSGITKGKYDRTIANLCNQIKAYNGPALIRFGHEMELSGNFGRYDWATSNYKSFIAAYQHAITVFKANLKGISGISYVWSPAGNDNANNYYPGDAYVDIVGCSLYSWSAYNSQYGYSGTFDEYFGWKYPVLSTHNKAVMVCEEGIEKHDNQAAWVAAAKAVYNKYPLLFAVVYFNSVDNWPWWPNGPIPDWSISPSVWTP
jgi:beta-mannanase